MYARIVIFDAIAPIRRIALCAAVHALILARPLAAAPRVEAPPATTPASVPDGVTLAPLVKLPDSPAFKPRASGWWKRKQPCPPGARPAKLKIASRYTAIVCRDRDGKSHGPSVALFAKSEQVYEDAWSVHGVNHGTRWTWKRTGKLDHVETFVDGKLQGAAEEWSAGTLIAAGAYLDGERHGVWTYRYPTKVIERGYYDRGHRIGTWIGAREGAATATIHGEHGPGDDGTARVFDAGGHLIFERVRGVTGGHATGWSSAGSRLAEYDCNQTGNLLVARFFDVRGTLARRWTEATRTLTDARGVTIALPDKLRVGMSDARTGCSYPEWLLEGPPPAYVAAFGKGAGETEP